MYSRNLFMLDLVRRFFVSCSQIFEAYAMHTLMKFGCGCRKISHKSKCGNTPKVHILITIEITIRYSFLNINRISKLSNYLSVKYIRNILDIPQFPSIVHFSSRNKRENCYLIHLLQSWLLCCGWRR